MPEDKQPFDPSMFKTLDEMRAVFPDKAEEYRETAEEEGESDGFVKKTVISNSDEAHTLGLDAEKKSEDYFRLVRLENYSEKILKTFGIWSEHIGTYGLNDEGSKFITDTFRELLWYALGQKRAEQLFAVINNFNKNYSETLKGQEKRDALLNELANFDIFQGKSIVDIGCGMRGKFVHFLDQLGAQAVGIDLQVKEDDEVIRHGDIRDLEKLPRTHFKTSFIQISKQAILKNPW